MGELHAFFDRDVYIKLVCCDIWGETLSALHVTHPYRLASASVKGCERPLERRKIDEGVRTATIERLHQICAAVPIIPEAVTRAAQTDALFNQMIGTANIDDGEAVLALGALLHDAPSRLITGDKRFLDAMAENFPDEFARLRPITVTFERCLLAVCDAIGFGAIRERLIAARGCDGTLGLALGPENQRDAEAFKEYLRGYDPLRVG